MSIAVVRGKSSATTDSEGNRNEQFEARNRSSTARRSGLADARFGEQLVETQRAANGPALAVDFRKRAERLLDRQFLSGALGENLVRVPRQRIRHAPDVVIGPARETARAQRALATPARSHSRIRQCCSTGS